MENLKAEIPGRAKKKKKDRNTSRKSGGLL